MNNRVNNQVNEADIKFLIDGLGKLLNGDSLNRNNFTPIIYRMLSLSGKLSISNINKKYTLIAAVELFIAQQLEQHIITVEEHDMLILLVNEVISHLIDTLCDAKKIKFCCC